MDQSINNIAGQIVEQLKTQLGEAWGRFSAEDLDLIRRCASDAAMLAIRGLATPAGEETLAREKRHVTAQLASIAACEHGRVAGELWAALAGILTRVAAVVMKR